MVLVTIWSGCRSEVVVVFERPKAATTLSVSAGGNEFTVSYTPPASSTALCTVAVGTLGKTKILLRSGLLEVCLIWLCL